MKKEWFATWFDTPYYHQLYKNRNDAEAKSFVTALCDHLRLPEGSAVLDLACGKGRHSVTLHEKGYQVLGVDLSENSIAQAEKFSTSGLEFAVHDMREVIPNRTFDAIFNLFTSFGYFDTTNENKLVLNAVHTMLKPKGLLVIDFMNAERVIAGLVEKESKQVGDLTFSIERRYDGTHIFKDIRFEDQGTDFHFTERVQALKLADFEALLSASGFEILRTFGNFNLAGYDARNSDRLIIIAQRN